MAIVDIDLLNHTNVLKISDARHEVDTPSSLNVLRITTAAYENINNTIFNNHNLLSNLNSDDHPQYLTITRADARYHLQTAFGDLAFVDTINNDNWSGTDLSVANGGTGASTETQARTNLGLGSIATQAAHSVDISGGFIRNTKVFSSINTKTTNFVMDGWPAVYVVTQPDLTATLPIASGDSLGGIYTVHLSSSGTLTVITQGSDTIMTSDSPTETSVVLNMQGMTLNFQVIADNLWVIV